MIWMDNVPELDRYTFAALSLTVAAIVLGLYFLIISSKPVYSVAQIYLHPVKSLRAVSVPEAELDEYGFKYDRQYMVAVKDDTKPYQLINLKVHPRLALVDTAIDPTAGTLSLAYPRDEPVARAILPIELTEKLRGSLPTVAAEIWSQTVESYDLSGMFPEVKKFWNSVFADKPELHDRVTIIGPKEHRTVSINVNPGDVPKGRNPTNNFQDYYPGSFITTASLEDLRSRVSSSTDGAVDVSARNFRANLVIDTDTPWAEDSWKKVRIGDVDFHIPQRKVRCLVTTVDPKRGKFEATNEPYKTMQTFRRIDEGAKYSPCFGMYLVHSKVGPVIRVGDPLQVLKTGRHRYIKFV